MKGTAGKIRKAKSHFDKQNYAMFGHQWDTNKNGIGMAMHWRSYFSAFQHSQTKRDDEFRKFTRWKSKADFHAEFNREVNFLLDDLRHSIESGDATWLGELKDGIEAWHKWVEGGGPEPQRDLLLGLYFKNGKQWKKPTIGELRAVFLRHGYNKPMERKLNGRAVKGHVCSISDKDIRELAKDAGIKLRPAKRGRPETSPDLFYKREAKSALHLNKKLEKLGGTKEQ
jgi:hypothetical protein